MISPEANKSKFSFTSLISKAYNNTFGVAVSYAYIYSNSFINSTSGVYNFHYKNFFLSKIDESYEFGKSTAHDIVIDILKTIPVLNGYFSYMSKVKAEKEVNLKPPEKENTNKLLAINSIINLNVENSNKQIEQKQNPKEINLGFDVVITSEENAKPLEYPKPNEEGFSVHQLFHNNSSPFEGWGASSSPFSLRPPPKINPEPLRINLYDSNAYKSLSNCLNGSEVDESKQFRNSGSDKYIFYDYPSPDISGGASTPYEEMQDPYFKD